MLDQMQAKLKEVGERESLKREDLIYVMHREEKEKQKPCMSSINKLKEKQRKRLLKFLNKYKENEILMVKCKENFQLENLFFKKDNYYVLTFPGILKTYEEVPFIIHDLKILNDSKGLYQLKIESDGFRIKSQHLFRLFEFINKIGKNECRYDEEYEYLYFNHGLVFHNADIREKFKDQLSIYECSTYEKPMQFIVRYY